LFPRTLNQLEEFKQGLTFPLYSGGPVEPEGLYFIHRSNNLIEGGTLVKDDLFFGGNFKQVVSLLNNQSIDEKDIKIFIGYCGWNAGDLEAEIAEGSWLITEENIEQIFTPTNTFNWNLLYQKLVSKS
jgi:putative transcriptional regulator